MLMCFFKRVYNMIRRLKNIVINKFNEFIEMVVYKEEFITNKKELIDKLYSEQEKEKRLDKGEEIENVRGRKFKYNEFGELEPIDNATIDDLQTSLYNSTRRSIDSFMGYGLANNWTSFLTLTFSQEILSAKGYDRYNDKDVKYLWQLFREKLQRKFDDVKLLCVPEPHNDGALHFHVLVSNFDFSPYMQKSPKKSKYGKNIYNINGLWEYGFSTIALIDEKNSQQAVTYYLQKYMKKSFNCNYNKKRYYHTNNLEYKEKFVGLVTDEKLDKIFKDKRVEVYKDNDKLTVYKIYSNI